MNINKINIILSYLLLYWVRQGGSKK